jgi:hypothetical protein
MPMTSSNMIALVLPDTKKRRSEKFQQHPRRRRRKRSKRKRIRQSACEAIPSVLQTNLISMM